jgi:RNA polymerase sigma-70 factor (ECF subfamily)
LPAKWVSAYNAPDAERTLVGSEQDRSLAQEGEIIAEVLAGNHERYYELIAPIERRVYYTAYAILRSEADAEEVAQETILKGFRSLPNFRKDARFSTWLLSIAMNEARMRLRQRREVPLEELKSPDSKDEYTPVELADWREIPAEALAQSELRSQLEEAVAILPELYREVLILRDIDGLNVAETAGALGVSEAVVKTRLCRARLMVRDYFVASEWAKPARKGKAHK